MDRARACIPVFLILGFLAGSGLLANKVPAAPASPAGGITVGEFALQVARLARDGSAERAALTPAQAVVSLRRAGLRFRSAPDGILTEGEMSDFFRQAGLQLQVEQPDRPVDPGRAGLLMAGFGAYFASRAADPSGSLPTAVSGGKPGSIPDSFSDCAALPTVPQCRNCCLALGGGNQACGRSCGRAHAGTNVSASEPTP